LNWTLNCVHSLSYQLSLYAISVTRDRLVFGQNVKRSCDRVL